MGGVDGAAAVTLLLVLQERIEYKVISTTSSPHCLPDIITIQPSRYSGSVMVTLKL